MAEDNLQFQSETAKLLSGMKSIRFGRLGHGHCFMYPGSILTILDSGEMFWKAATQSSSDNDTWYSGFYFFAENGELLFTMPAPPSDWYWIHMESAHRAYDWNENWTYDLSFFPRIHHVEMRYRC